MTLMLLQEEILFVCIILESEQGAFQHTHLSYTTKVKVYPHMN